MVWLYDYFQLSGSILLLLCSCVCLLVDDHKSGRNLVGDIIKLHQNTTVLVLLLVLCSLIKARNINRINLKGRQSDHAHPLSANLNTSAPLYVLMREICSMKF